MSGLVIISSPDKSRAILRPLIKIARFARAYRRLELDVLNMASADSQAQGLAESQELPASDFKEFEDPARCWIDLVLAFKGGDPNRVRDVLTQAKASHWNHDLYNDALMEPDYTSGEEIGTDPGWEE